MKKNVFTRFAAAALVLAAVACQREDMLDGNSQNGSSVELVPLTISATLESDQTKTSLQEGGKVYWENGDAMTVLAVGEDAIVTSYKFTTTDEGPEATFTNDKVALAENYYAVYPYVANETHKYLFDDYNTWVTTIEDSKLRVYVPSLQRASVAGSVGLDAFSVGKVAEDGSVAMKNLGGLIKINIPVTDVESVILYGNNDETLVGNAYVTFGEDGIPSILSVTGDNTVRIVPAAGDTFAVGEYYINVLPVTFTDGLSVIFTKSNDTWASVRSSGEFVVERSKISSLPEISSLNFGGKVVDVIAVKDNGANQTPFTSALPGSTDNNHKGVEVSYTLKDTDYKFKLCGTTRHYRTGKAGICYGQGAGDYIELPAIDGYALNKIVLKSGSDGKVCGNPDVCDNNNNKIEGTKTWDLAQKVFGLEHTWSFAGNANTSYRITRSIKTSDYVYIHQLRLYYADAPGGVSSIKPLITSVTTSEPDIDPYVGKATFSGSFTAVDYTLSALSCGFEYKKVSESEWTSVTCSPTATEFSYEFTDTAGDEYVYRAWTKVNATGKTVYGSEVQFNATKLVLHLVFHGQEGRDLLMTQWGWKTNGNNSSTERGYDMNGLSYNFTYNGVDYPFTFWALQSGVDENGIEATSGGYCFRHTDNTPNEALCLSNLGKKYAPEGHPAWMQFPGPAGMKLIEVDATQKGDSFSGHICTAVKEDGTWSGESLATYSKNSSFPIKLENTSAGVRYYFTTEHINLPRITNLTLTYLYVGE